MNISLYAVYDQSVDSRIFLSKPHRITTLCSFENLLFLGTYDGYLLQVIYDETDDEETYFSFGVIFERRVSENIISRLQTSRYAEFVAALSNNKLQFLDAEKLESSPLHSALDNVSTFSIKDSDLSSERHAILAVCTMSQYLQVYRVVKIRMDLVNTINLSSIALDVFCVDNFAVIASSKNYIGVDLKTKISHEIFARTGSLDRPLIDSFSEDEFLLSGPDSLGIFVNSVGQSNRPPLTLSTNLLALFSRQQLVFTVDDEFLTIHSASLQKQVQTLVVQNVCAACMSLDRNVIFLATYNPTTNASQIRVVQPETWDLVAKRLILAGCLSDASTLLNDQFTKLANLCNERPATSGHAKMIFNTRSKRVYTLMGLYLFENGQLVQSREFFEKSSLDIRELLSRYVDLLPRGYEFTADPTLHITASSKAIPESSPPMTENQPPPCNIFNLAEITGVSVTEFRKFLLNFLLENRRGRIFAQHSQLVETAILKLCVQLSEGSEVIYCEGYENWNELVESLSSVDFEDLQLFLNEHHAYHVKALLCRRNRDVQGALEIWKSLTLGVLVDKHFPGSDYYLDALFTALTLPTAFREHNISTTTKAVSTSPLGTLAGCTAYADLVSRHLESFLDSADSLPLADALIRRLACITSWNDTSSSSHQTTSVSSTNGKFVLATNVLLKRLRSQHPDMAENYLWLKIFKAGDKDPSHHTLLAELQLQLLLKYAESKDEEKLVRQRLRFRYTLSRLGDCQTEKLLASLKSSSSAHLFTEEYVTLLGKLKKYDEALGILVLKENNLEDALRFCSWCTEIDVRQRLTENSTLWNHKKINGQVPKCSHTEIPKSNAYTVLLKLLLTSDDPSLLEQSKKVLAMEIPPLDFTEILKVLPDDWRIDLPVSAFLTNAMKTTLTRESKSNVELGLATQIASASRNEASVSIARGLPVTDASKCLQCHLPLSVYGDLRPFAWILTQEYSSSSVMHLHCLKSDSAL